MPETRATVYQALSLFCNSSPPPTAFWSKYCDHSPTHGCTEAPDHLGLIMENKMFSEMNEVTLMSQQAVAPPKNTAGLERQHRSPATDLTQMPGVQHQVFISPRISIFF